MKKILLVVLCVAIAVAAIFTPLYFVTRGEFDGCRSELAAANTTIEEQVKAIESLNSDVEVLNGEVSTLTSQISDLGNQVEKLNAEIAERDARIVELGGGPPAVGEDESLTATEYIEALKTAGMPIKSYIEYNEETDDNELLGRPGQYISKINFADDRVSQYDEDENPVGGSIEVFKTAEDLQRRKEYIESVQAASPILGADYMYISADGLALLRVHKELTPEQAEEYKNEFVKITK